MTCLVIHTPRIQDLDSLIQVPVLSLHWRFQFSGEYECNCYINQCNARTKAMQYWNATNELKCNRGFRLNYKKNPAKNNRQWFHSNEAQSNTCNTEKSTMTRLANKISGFDGYFATFYILLCSSSPGGLWVGRCQPSEEELIRGGMHSSSSKMGQIC